MSDEDTITDHGAGIQAVVLQPIQYDPTVENMESLILAMQRFGRHKLRYAIPQKRTLVDTARNRLLHTFMQDYDAPYAIFIDADMGLPIANIGWWRYTYKTTLPPRYAVNFFERLLSHPIERGIVGATYVDRKVGAEIQCSRGCGTGKQPGFSESWNKGSMRGLVECDWVGTGAVRISRWVVEKLIANVDRWPESKPTQPGRHYGFFQRPHHARGEDVGMCLRAKELGIQSYLDTDLKVFHRGTKFY